MSLFSEPIKADDLPLDERVRRGVGAELRGDRENVLGAIGVASPAQRTRRRLLPERWTVLHVIERIEEAFQVLGRTPARIWPRQFGNSMPRHLYDRADLNSQLETGELERMMRVRNRVRLSATPAEIARMNQAIAWPMEYLADKPEVARAVCLAAVWYNQQADIGERCATLNLTRRAFNRRVAHGLSIIAGELIRRGVPVS